MIIAARYSFNRGAEVVTDEYSALLGEVECAIASVDAQSCKVKRSKEKTKEGRMLFSPARLNKAFKAKFGDIGGWEKKRVTCRYSTDYYEEAYRVAVQGKARPGFREIDFLKGGLGVEIQFGKYSFMVYNVAAKMTIFRNLGHITAGVEVVPMKRFVREMSSGVSYFEQFAWDLENRGVADIDVPVLILGIDDVQ